MDAHVVNRGGELQLLVDYVRACQQVAAVLRLEVAR